MKELTITSIKVHKTPKNDKSNIVGIASIVIDKSFVIKDIRIINTKNKMFCAMPSRRLTDGNFVDICHPINIETRKRIESLILAEFINLDTKEKGDDEK